MVTECVCARALTFVCAYVCERERETDRVGIAAVSLL